MIMFCHGHVSAYIFDDGDDVSEIHVAQRSAAVRSKLPQQTWVGLLISRQ